MMKQTFTPGQVIEVPNYPFTRTVFNGEDESGPFQVEGWRPGVETEFDGGFDVESVADSTGSMILTVISTHKPGRFPERIFYTRQWRDPDGKVFGATKLRIATVEKFRRIASRYQHPFYNAETDTETQA